MVSVIRIATLALVGSLVALLQVETTDAAIVSLPVGKYYRPCGDQVSGHLDATTEYRRSPCPALNSLANGGYLPRDGKSITNAQAKAIIMDVFNLAEDIAQFMASRLPATFNLNDLAKHNFIEHDASLSRVDTHFGADPAEATPAFLGELLARGLDGKLTLEDVAAVRVARIANSKANNPEFSFGATQVFLANSESGLMLRGLGGANTEEISFANFYSFFVEERFPTEFTRSPTPITFAQITNTSTAIQALQG